MSDATKAVFLSYASQDAEAAKRIADALRGAGVEVWFDAEGGLEHGDEWDAKIRRQIKECVLFIPLISANTQAREEGYFRIEWELAAQRALGIASGVAFILPVLIDDTREAEALAPDRFHTVQWTKLPDGNVPPEVLQRFLKLWSHRAGVVKHQREKGAKKTRETGEGRPESGSRGPNHRGRRPRLLVPLVVAVFILVAALGAWRRFHPAPGLPPPAAAAPSAPSSEAQQLVAKAWTQLNKAELARAELEVADGLCRRATELEPNNADAWSAWSQVDSWYVYHDLDDTATRRESARTRAAHALQLEPNSYEARLAQACYLVRSSGGHGGTTSLFDEEAKGLLTTLLREKPAEPRALLAFGILLRNTGHAAEARATFESLAANPAWAALAWNEIGWAAYLTGDNYAAEAAADRSIARQPCWPNLALKMLLSELWTGDLDEGKRMLEKIPPAVRQEDHGVAFACQLYYYRREPQNVLRVLDGVSRDWLSSNAFEGPKAFWAGLAHELAGRKESARLQWEASLQQVEQRLARQPEAGELLWWKGYCLARLGRRDEAGKFFQLAHESGASLETVAGVSGRVVGEILLGRDDEAVDLLEKRDSQTTAAWVRLFPGFDPLRTNPRFQALLARLEADPQTSPKAAPAPSSQLPSPSVRPEVEPKSVAVLAFANLSDDKANEYFSDGISEELLNVLAKVPGLKVTARTSSFHFKGKDTPISEIARQLGVAYVVEGSVRKAGDKVRITAQLIKAADGFHVWSDTFTRDLKDIFAVQDEIAGLVAKNLEAKLGTAPRAEATVDGRALELYMQGRAAWNRRNADGFDRAEALFRQALDIAPDYARAHAALADVWMIRAISDDQLSRYGQRASPVTQPIEAEAMRALELDPESAEAHATLGFLRQLQHRPDEALRLLRRSVELNPNYPTGHHWLAGMLAYQSWFDECIAEYRRAVAVDPLSPRILDNFGWTLVTLGRLQEGLEFIDRALALQPNEPQALAHRVFTLARLGRREEARALGATVADRYRLAVLAETGDRAAIEAALPAAQGPDRGLLLSALGRQDEALDYFQPDDVILEDTQDWFFDPKLVPWHHDPRFRRVVDELGFEEPLARALAWQAAHPPEQPAPAQKTGDRGQESAKPQEPKP